MFHGTQTFTLAQQYTHLHLSFRPSAETSLFLFNLLPGQVSSIRNLKICVPAWLHGKHTHDLCTTYVALDRSECGYQIKFEGVGFGYGQKTFKAFFDEECKIEALEDELYRVLENVSTQGGTKQFRGDDIHALRKAVETGMAQRT